METVETLIKFINSYPLWAKAGIIAGAFFSISIAVFAPRDIHASPNNQDNESTTKRTYMRIEGVKLYPDNENIDIQVFAFVNGTSFKHPSVGGVEWMKVGPNMSHKIIELPKAEAYQIRFELRYKEGDVVLGSSTNLVPKEFNRMASQMVTQVLKYPFTEVYNLYKVNDRSRGASVSASVKYTLYQE